MPLANPAGDWVACRAAVGEVEAWEGEAVAMLDSESIDLHYKRLFFVVGHGVCARRGKSARARRRATRAGGHVCLGHCAKGATCMAGGSLGMALAMRVVRAATRVRREVRKGCRGGRRWVEGGAHSEHEQSGAQSGAQSAGTRSKSRWCLQTGPQTRPKSG